MRSLGKLGLIGLLGVIGACTAVAQKPPSKPDSHAVGESDAGEKPSHKGALSEDDRLSLIAAALDVRSRSAEPDCSHLVHAIYEQAGFAYSYAPSSDLYAGVDGFQRVKKPEPGDLVVWRGHAGIVIKPSRHIFFSVLSTGPGIDDYTTPYWKHRGKPRFYRYLKSSSGKRNSAPQLLRTNRVRRPSSDVESDDDQ